MSKLLSIIIPTKNRQIYCKESVLSILTDIDDRCEIVIKDNSDDDSLRNELLKMDARIVYNYNSKPLSFVDNFEEALMLSHGKYFIILGDDDSTTKDILPIVEWMERENIESVSSDDVVDYVWPNDNILKYKNGFVSVPNYDGSSRDINVRGNLTKLVENGFLYYPLFDLPRTYHGIVKRSSMDEVKRITGRYFGGLTPDIYSTIALSCIIKNHKIVNFPFSIAGACPKSATVNATIGGHAGKLDEAPHFNHIGQYIWEESIPKYYSVETIWAETAIKALKDMKNDDLLKSFNNTKLYLVSILNNRKYIFKVSLKETFKTMSTHQNFLKNSLGLFFTSIKFFSNKLKAKRNEKVLPFTNNKVKSLDDCKAILYDVINDIRPHNS